MHIINIQNESHNIRSEDPISLISPNSHHRPSITNLKIYPLQYYTFKEEIKEK